MNRVSDIPHNRPGYARGAQHIANAALDAAQTAALIDAKPLVSIMILASALVAIRDAEPWPVPLVFGGMGTTKED